MSKLFSRIDNRVKLLIISHTHNRVVGGIRFGVRSRMGTCVRDRVSNRILFRVLDRVSDRINGGINGEYETL